MFKKITFSSSYKDFILAPLPSKKLVPNWYKKMPNFNGEIKNFQRPTVKKCVPFLDSLTSGYFLLNPMDIVFWKEKEDVHWRYPDQVNTNDFPNINVGIELHHLNQVSNEILREEEEEIVFKWLNPWVIKTPKNYSCLFVNPFHREDNPTRIIEGIVDTDQYCTQQINFPFFIKQLKEGESLLIKKGHPIVLIFPFLRDDWKLSIKNHDNAKMFLQKFKFFSKVADNYKSIFWKKKNYD